MTTVYILRSNASARYYAGFTSNLRTRLKQHRSAQNHSTAHADDWEVVWTTTVASSLEARAWEKKIKKRGIGRFLADQEEAPFQPTPSAW